MQRRAANEGQKGQRCGKLTKSAVRRQKPKQNSRQTKAAADRQRAESHAHQQVTTCGFPHCVCAHFSRSLFAASGRWVF